MQHSYLSFSAHRGLNEVLIRLDPPYCLRPSGWNRTDHECLYTNPSRCPAQHLAKVARARGVTVSQGLLPESFTASALDQAKQN